MNANMLRGCALTEHVGAFEMMKAALRIVRRVSVGGKLKFVLDERANDRSEIIVSSCGAVGEQKREIKPGHHIVGHAESRPPDRDAGISNQVAMHDVEQAVSDQAHSREPETRSKSNDGQEREYSKERSLSR